LGSPQRSFESIHVVGTNGKSSTTQMAAAILERHGVRTGAYTSPHLVGYRERIHIGARELSGEAFARAIARAAAAAERVARELPARLQHASERAPGAQLLARGAFQERNFALARLAAETSLLQAGAGLPDASARERAAREAAASVLVPGRLQLLDGDPPTVLDGAHNPAAVAALLESLPGVVG